jgi:hypothetical protein
MFRGEGLEPINSSYARLILPAVAVKRFFQTLYRLVVNALWSELSTGKAEDQLFVMLVCLIFCVLSLLAYYSRAVSIVFF